ncbi:unnamed protein product, partial [Durusdinium trenchii]
RSRRPLASYGGAWNWGRHLGRDMPVSELDFHEVSGLGVPFPVAPVLIQKPATLQLKSGLSMPLLVFAVSGKRRPSVTDLAELLRMGVRHLQVSPSVVQAVGQAVRLSQVPRSELFISMLWEPPLDTSAKLDSLTEQLGFVDLMILPQTPELESVWKHLERLKARKRFKALGVKDFRPEEVEFLPGNGESVEYAQCAFTPYRHGPRRDTWRRFGQREVALAATGLFTDWPRPLPPLLDPHVLIIARRFKRSAAQVLIRWALQLGLAVVFHSQRKQHVAENLAALDFELPMREMQLISGLATLAEPVPPGDGFAHPYEQLRTPKGEL